MFGAICGDILGSPYESWINQVDAKDFNLYNSLCKFTDDTCLTLAIADAILSNVPYEDKLQEWYNRYPNLGYGSTFVEWCETRDKITNPLKMNSYSNGAMMRVSPIAYAFDKEDDMLLEVRKSIECTHNSDEAYRGAASVATVIHLSNKGVNKADIKSYIENKYSYDLDHTVQDVRDKFSKSTIRCDVTGPQSLICFFEGYDYESVIRNAIYSKGDCDTIAAIAGSMAEAYYKDIPENILDFCMDKLPNSMLDILGIFTLKFMNK